MQFVLGKLDRSRDALIHNGVFFCRPLPPHQPCPTVTASITSTSLDRSTSLLCTLFPVFPTGNRYLMRMRSHQKDSSIASRCEGGKEWDAYEYWIKSGLVTGGTAYTNANQPTGCLPYPYGIDRTPSSCPTSCSVAHSKTFDQDKIYGKLGHLVRGSAIDMHLLICRRRLQTMVVPVDRDYPEGDLVLRSSGGILHCLRRLHVLQDRYKKAYCPFCERTHQIIL